MSVEALVPNFFAVFPPPRKKAERFRPVLQRMETVIVIVCTLWEARQWLVDEITKLTRAFGVGWHNGVPSVAFVVVLQDSNVLRPRSERACRRTTAVPF